MSLTVRCFLHSYHKCEVTLLSEVPTYVPLSANWLVVVMISKDTTLGERCPDVQHPTSILVSCGSQWIMSSEGHTLITDKFSIVSIPVATGHNYVNNWVLLYNKLTWYNTSWRSHTQAASHMCYPWMYTKYPISHLSHVLNNSFGWSVCTWYGTLC